MARTQFAVPRCYPALMANRKGFLLIVMTVTLMFPARATVRQWGRRQLGVNPEGSFMHGVGEVLVTVL
jgi:hypothetical protein